MLLRVIYLNKFKMGKGTTFRKGFSVMIGDQGKVHIGRNCFFNNYLSIASMENVNIDDGTIVGECVKIYDHNHKYSDMNVPLKDQGYVISPVKIGKRCWIGSNVVILKGVTIGDNCVIGAGCVIYKDVAANSVVINKQAQSITLI
ncbi:acyltransferase [Arcticibacter tournemirensis]|uniref:Acyltransferase n=2 Tax=Arcticibacter tournemirensis TaxID=699437 RepID=A0A4Q0M9D5_9SPHI|nr:acyltransferase [Arcticibacter tournemirensis]